MRIAITGGIAEGKSTVLRYIAEEGISTCSSDEIARSVFASDEVQAALSEMLGAPRPIDSAAVRTRIAVDAALRRRVNALTHPRILRELASQDASATEVPLLIEACLHPLFERVWVVTCGQEEQGIRLARRLGSRDEAQRLVRTQLATEVKCAFADRIVRTNRPEASVHEIVIESIHRDLR